MRGDQAFIDQHGLERLLESAVDAARDLFYVYDTTETLVAWNERVNEATGYTDGELLSMSPTEFVPEGEHEAHQNYVDAAWDGEGTLRGHLLAKDGSTTPYEFYGDVLREAGSVVGRVGIGRQVAERRGYRKRLERRNERLERAASLIDHDIRSPLHSAKGFLELYQETRDEELLERALSAHERVEEILDRLADITRPSAIAEETERVSVGELASRAWHISLADVDGELTTADPPSVEADRALLTDLLENLFRNAAQHSDHLVTIEVGALPGDAGFYVVDDGPGIPPEDRDTVFEWGHSGGDGSGFGLTLVAEVADAHGWCVDIREGNAGGARFELRTGG